MCVCSVYVSVGRVCKRTCRGWGDGKCFVCNDIVSCIVLSIYPEVFFMKYMLVFLKKTMANVAIEF